MHLAPGLTTWREVAGTVHRWLWRIGPAVAVSLAGVAEAEPDRRPITEHVDQVIGVGRREDEIAGLDVDRRRLAFRLEEISFV